MTLDRQLAWLGAEINQLRGQRAPWAEAKIEALQEIQASLHTLRELQQDVRPDGVPRTFKAG